MRLRPRRPTTLSKASSPGRLAALFCSVLCLFVCFLFYLLSKILELNGLTECSLDEATAQATLLDLLEKFEKKYGHSRVEREHKNKLLHRCFYKMEADNTEKDSATDRTKQTQSGSVDGSQLGSLMDAFSGSSTAIEVNVTAAFNKNVATLKQLKVKIAKLHEEGVEISSTLLSFSEKMYSAICKDIDEKMEALNEFARKLRTNLATFNLANPEERSLDLEPWVKQVGDLITECNQHLNVLYGLLKQWKAVANR